MSEFDFNNDLPKKPSENEWDLDWDEQWDQDSLIEPNSDEKTNLEVALEVSGTTKYSNKKFKNELEKALVDEENYDDHSPDLNWGIIDDTKPTNLNARLKSILNAPFSAVLDAKKPKLVEKSEPSLEKDSVFEIKEKEKPRPKLQFQTPKVISTIGESNRRNTIILRETSDLSFNNLNNITAKELKEINKLLEGSLGKSDKVKFEDEVVQDKNINFVAEEKVLNKKRETAKIELSKKEILDSAELTIASDTHPGDTIVPGLNDVRFDLKSAQESSDLFQKHEINEIMKRLPAEKARAQKEKIFLSGKQESYDNESNKIGDSLFATDEKITLTEKPASSTDDLLDSLLNEIDGELGESSFGDNDFAESMIDSSGKDEIIKQENIIDDNNEAALEFMDSAAMEAESLFENFFKQGTEGKEKEEVKITYKDIINEKIKLLNTYYLLVLRFLKDPKYFFEYFQIKTKDVYIAIGLFFTLLTFTGLLNLQFITERFPMNLF
jgi:hypothetical protein